MNIINSLFYAIPLLSAFCNLFLLLTFLSAKKDKLMRSFMWLLIHLTVWPLASFFMRVGIYPGETFWFQTSVTAVFLVPLCIYSFLHHYTGQRGTFLLSIFKIGTFIMVITNLMGVYLTDPHIVVLENGSRSLEYGTSFLCVFPLVFASIILIMSVITIYKSVKHDGLPMNMFYPFYLGVAIMFTAILIDLIPGLSSKFPVDPFACMLDAILIYYMLYKKHLFTLTQFASNGSTYLVSTVLTGFIGIASFSGINRFIHTYFTRSQEYKTLLTAILFSVMTIVVFNLLKILTNNLFVKGAREKDVLLKNFSLAVNKTLNRDEILTLFIDLIREHTSVETAYIFIYSRSKKSYQIQACTDKMRAKAVKIAEKSPLIKWLHVHKEGITYSSFKQTTNYKSMWESEKHILELLHSEYVFPIIYDDDLTGFVILSEKANHKSYSYSEIGFLESVASVAQIAIKNASLYETMQKEAHMDSLTNIYNRRYFTDEFERIFKENIHNTVTIALINFDDFKLYNELYGSHDGDRILRRFAGILKSVIGSRGIIGRYSGKEFCICLPVCSSKEAEYILAEIRQRLNHYLSSAEESTKKFLTFSAGICTYPTAASDSRQLITYANMAVYACKKSGKNKTIVYSKQHHNVSNSLTYKNMEAIAQEYAPTIYALTAAIDAKDHYTFSHSENVSVLATQLAQAIGLDNEHVEMIRQAGLLHDIGKISIPEHILTKTSRLTNEEYDIIKSHVENSIAMIRHLPSLDYVIPIAISHHERYDGKGYPRGLSGEEIPVGGRCLGIADAFDAIVSRRPYKEPVSIPEALKEIERNLGKQFDPVIGNVFINLVKDGTINTEFYN